MVVVFIVFEDIGQFLLVELDGLATVATWALAAIPTRARKVSGMRLSLWRGQAAQEAPTHSHRRHRHRNQTCWREVEAGSKSRE